MIRYLLPALLAFAMSMGLPQLVHAETSAEPATLIVYRADESYVTERLRFDVHADELFVGRLKADKANVIKAPAGTYLVDTSMPGAAPLEIDLKPGAVHYVHSKLKIDCSRVRVELVEVGEEVAISHGAKDVAGTI